MSSKTILTNFQIPILWETRDTMLDVHDQLWRPCCQTTYTEDTKVWTSLYWNPRQYQSPSGGTTFLDLLKTKTLVLLGFNNMHQRLYHSCVLTKCLQGGRDNRSVSKLTFIYLKVSRRLPSSIRGASSRWMYPDSSRSRAKSPTPLLLLRAILPGAAQPRERSNLLPLIRSGPARPDRPRQSNNDNSKEVWSQLRRQTFYFPADQISHWYGE